MGARKEAGEARSVAEAERENVSLVKSACLKLKEHLVEASENHATTVSRLESEVESAKQGQADAEVRAGVLEQKAGEMEASLSKLAVRKAALLNEITRLESELELAHAEVNDVKARTRDGWMDNSAADACSCGVRFSLTKRKHHCRHCGRIFCHDCSSHKLALAGSKNPVRVCDPCHSALTTPTTRSKVVGNRSSTQI